MEKDKVRGSLYLNEITMLIITLFHFLYILLNTKMSSDNYKQTAILILAPWHINYIFLLRDIGITEVGPTSKNHTGTFYSLFNSLL